MPSPEFELSTVEVEKVNGVVSNDDLLELYAFFKVANGVDFDSAPKPGTFDFVGKAKHKAWEKEKGLNQKQGEQKYIAKVDELKKKHGYDPKRTTKADNKPIDAAKLKKFDDLSKQLGKNQ